MSAADPEYIAFAGPAQLLFDLANTVDGVTGNPLEWYRRGYGAGDHSRRKLWFGRKADIGGHICGCQAIRIAGPLLRKIQRTVDQRMTVARNVGGEDSDLAVGDLARGTRVLPRHSARRLAPGSSPGQALLEKAGLADHEDRIVIRQMLDDIIAYDIAQSLSIPIPAAQDRLLTPWAGIASCLRAHPTSLALLISKQTFQKQACIRRNTLLTEQRTYPLLDLPKRRRPQRKRLLNRRRPRPRSSNHGCPWIQKSAKKATVMLGIAAITPAKVERLAILLKDRLFNGEPELRQSYARLMMREVRVTHKEIRISGSKSVLARCAIEDVGETAPAVLSFVQEWRALRDSNS